MATSTSAVSGAAPVSGLATTPITSSDLRQKYSSGLGLVAMRCGYTIQGMSLSVITVTGMTCEHCEKAVRIEISAIPGVSQVDVDLASGEVKIQAEPAQELAALLAAVEEAGYQLTEPS